MKFEQMKESLKTIKLLEKDLMRDLTKEEKEIVINDGWETFLFDYLGITDDEFKELKYLKQIISAFYTQDESKLEELIKEAPTGIYFTLMDIADMIDAAAPCSNSYCEDKAEGNPVSDKAEVGEKDQTAEYAQFMEDLYNSLPKGETPWFNQLSEDIHNKLFKVYKEHRNEKTDCSDNCLCGVMTDAVKDEVIKDMVNKLKSGEVVDMTNDEYLEVADFLCQTEDHIFLSNENGKVRLTIL